MIERAFMFVSDCRRPFTNHTLQGKEKSFFFFVSPWFRFYLVLLVRIEFWFDAPFKGCGSNGNFHVWISNMTSGARKSSRCAGFAEWLVSILEGKKGNRNDQITLIHLFYWVGVGPILWGPCIALDHDKMESGSEKDGSMGPGLDSDPTV